MSKVLLGFTVPDGEPYYLPLGHTCITGMTQYGKSTTGEAILRRSKSAKSLVFLTKRGEKTFADANRIPPFYKERFDWEYVRGLLEAAMREKLKFETPWIMRISKAVNLAPVEQRNLSTWHKYLKQMLTREQLREFDRNIYTLLDGYMDKVTPVLDQARQQLATQLTLKEGLNVEDLTEWYQQEAFQMVLIGAAMDHILEVENNTRVMMPEAWKMLPQGRNTPVKLRFEKYVREGATNGNFLYIDAQDLGGVDKEPLRQVSLWIMGKMMQADEVERLLKQTFKVTIKPVDIQTLQVGHFIVVNGIENRVDKVYVWPWGVPEQLAKDVAAGKIPPEVVKEWLVERQKLLNEHAHVELPEDLLNRVNALSRRVDNLTDLETLTTAVKLLREDFNKHIDINHQPKFQDMGVEIGEAQVTLQHPIYKVEVENPIKDFKLTTETPEGKVMWLAKDGFFKNWRRFTDVNNALTEAKMPLQKVDLMRALKNLCDQGFLATRKTDRSEYSMPDNVRFIEGERG